MFLIGLLSMLICMTGSFTINTSCAAAASHSAAQHRASQKKDRRKRKSGGAAKKKTKKRKTVVLAGSSSIEYWKKAPSAFYPLKTVNVGIAGTTAEEWLSLYFRRITKYRPDAVVLYVGGNDIIRKGSRNSGIETAHLVCQLLTRLRKTLPGVPVYYISVAPSPRLWDMWNQAKQCNGIVSWFCSRYRELHFINLAGHCLNRRGGLKKGLYRTDGLHFNRKGYKIWKKVIAKRVKSDLRSG